MIPKVLQGVIPLGLQGDGQESLPLTHCYGCSPQLMADGCPMTTLGGAGTGLFSLSVFWDFPACLPAITPLSSFVCAQISLLSHNPIL